MLVCGDNSGSATVSASGGTPQYFYSWSHGGNGSNAFELSAGVYTVNITDINGCFVTQSTTISGF